jgi:uncharacterized membrane-anchored protein
MFVLLFPIVILLALTAYKRHILLSGQEVILPISGYDPRDLISGHYLRYRVEYGIPDICYGEKNDSQSVFICLEKKISSIIQPGNCKIVIHGFCENSQFYAGIEKFYIPESQAKSLEELIRSKKASIVISVTTDGTAQVKDLLIDGKSWHAKQY